MRYLLLPTAFISIAAIHDAAAQPSYEARQATFGCATERAALALTNTSDPRLSDQGFVDYVRQDGHCVQITPASRWAVLRRAGRLLLVQNVVPGTRAQFYVPAIDMGPVGAPSTSRALRSAIASRTGGKYCTDNNSTMFLVRPSAGGTLEFALRSWASNGHLFTAGGTAQPSGSGWVSRDNWTSADPGERCESVIGRLLGGGYSYHVSDQGTCSAENGWSPRPGLHLDFPASARHGAIPADKTMEQAASEEAGGERCP
jgi:hypothetical protein